MLDIGSTRILITRDTAFDHNPNKRIPPKLIKIVITEKHSVRASYSGNVYDGYVAKGEDGNTYHCQYPYFDELSQDPYANWERDGFLEIAHGDIVGEFLLWDVTRVIEYREDPAGLLTDIDVKYPNCIAICQEKFHNGCVHGLYYREEGCYLCILFDTSIKKHHV